VPEESLNRRTLTPPAGGVSPLNCSQGADAPPAEYASRSSTHTSLQPIECLGLTFPNDAARRGYFLEKLRDKLADPAFRRLEGFPIGDDDAILALSDPPYYTACPNPFLEEFLVHGATKTSELSEASGVLPFAADVRIARHDAYSLAHTYHTKVSPLAIVQYVEHFTRPGDVMLDCFCGSGMTGLAAAGAAADFGSARPYLRADQPRRAVLMDLSPAATHIAAGHAARFTPEDVAAVEDFIEAAQRSERRLFDVPHRGHTGRREAWAGKVSDRSPRAKGILEYLVWSEVLICPHCRGDVVFGEAAYDPVAAKVAAGFPCPHCGRRLRKRRCRRRMEEYIDPVIGGPARRPKLAPLFTAYRVGCRRYYRRALPEDAGPRVTLDGSALPAARPVLRGERFFKDALHDVYGITHVHQFYTPRNCHALARLAARVRNASGSTTRLLRFVFSSIAVKASKLMNYNADGVGRVLKGTLYASSLVQECNPFWLAELALKDVARLARAAHHDPRHILISTQSAAATLPEASVDYVWIDPPFGKSLMYAELNQLWEWWLGVRSAETAEAVLDERRGKDLPAYTEAMTRCLAQAHRALKPGRWLTVAFHNSQSAVWNAIQKALGRAGFVVADVRALDKKLLTYKQSQQGLARVDLVISAYKRHTVKQGNGRLKIGSKAGAWRFVREQLTSLPEPPGRAIVAERTNHWLYDRMVANQLRRGMTVPLSAPEFFAGLRERFTERDGMFFLNQPRRAKENG
jgi:16S rRNA G966 N2-methylase RsmD